MFDLRSSWIPSASSYLLVSFMSQSNLDCDNDFVDILVFFTHSQTYLHFEAFVEVQSNEKYVTY